MHGHGRIFCGIDGCQDARSTVDSYRKHAHLCHSALLMSEYTCGTLSSSCGRQMCYEDDNDDEGLIDSCASRSIIAAENKSKVELMMTQFSQRTLLFALQIRERYLLPASTCSSILNDVQSLDRKSVV